MPHCIDAPSTPTGVLLSEKVYNSSEFASAMLSWNDPTGRVDSYNIKISVGSSDSQQFSVAMPSLKINQIPYNENITVSISAVNCIAESEEVNSSFVISKHFHLLRHMYLDAYCCTGACNSSLSLPFGGLVYNTSSYFNGILPSGGQIWFGCEQGFYLTEHVVSTCQEDGLWYPDPSEVVWQSKRCAHCHYGNI